MPNRYTCFVIPEPIDEVWDKTLAFWKENRGEIKDKKATGDLSYRELTVRHKASMKAYGFSSGEKYHMKFGYDREKHLTYAVVIGKFNLFGRGFVWKFPEELIKRWTEYIGVQPAKMSTKAKGAFAEVQAELEKILAEATAGREINFCPFCGNEVNPDENFCGSCGTHFHHIVA